jgi:hypothetical protein
MLFAGHALKKHGVYFQEALKKEKGQGFLMNGYDYQKGRDNQRVPFIEFEYGKLVVIRRACRCPGSAKWAFSTTSLPGRRSG